MTAVEQSMATVHQPLLAPPSPLSVYSRAITPRPSPRLSPSPVRRAAKPVHRHIWIVAGTSCCGKTTIATDLSQRLGAGSYIEGDDHHSAENKAKMAAGTPLTDKDRAPWLRKLRSLAVSRLDSRGESNVVVTCSALKAKYRDIFREAERMNDDIKVHFLFLIAPEGVLIKRAASRPGHFFKGQSMIKSQFDVLELPDHRIERDALTVDCTKPEDVVGANVLRKVKNVLAEDSR